MIINSHLYPSYFVDSDWKSGGEPVSAERLIEILDGPYPVMGKSRRIDYGIVQAPPPETPSPRMIISAVWWGSGSIWPRSWMWWRSIRIA